jgi:arsenite methyltransferase
LGGGGQVAERNMEAYRQALGYSTNNMRFVEGYLEDLEGAGLAPESVDLIISNCVINLSPDKERVVRPDSIECCSDPI